MLQELNAQCQQNTGVDSLTCLIWLTLSASAIGTEGFMIAGLLPALARDLNVGLPAAGHLVTAFSLAYKSGRFRGVRPPSRLAALEDGKPGTSVGKCSSTPHQVPGAVPARAGAPRAGSSPSAASSPSACSPLD